MKHLTSMRLRHPVLFLLLFACAALLAPLPAHAQLFWASFSTNRIGGANLDGTEPDHSHISTGAGPSGVAVDGSFLYWSNRTSNTIGRASLDGTGVENDFITGLTTPTDIAVDGSFIYWTNQTGDTIGRAALDKSTIEPSFITGAFGPTGVAVDGSFIYWTNQDTGTIGRANLNGSSPDQTFITGASEPTGVTVDGSFIYWTDDGTDTIGRAALDKSTIEPSFITGAVGPYGLATDGTFLYWASRTTNQIGRANLDGTEPSQTFITGTGGQPRGIAIGPNSMLPVELASFTATLDGDGVVLAWTTASETGNAGFDVEHHAGGAFRRLAFVEGAGTTAQARAYTHRVAGLSPGVHRFRLRQVDYDGAFAYSPEVEVAVGVPSAYVLSEAYPNPFNPATTLTLSVAVAQRVAVSVYDALGRRVARLFEGPMAAGVAHPIMFEAAGLPGGLYFVRAEGEAFTAVQPVTLVK